MLLPSRQALHPAVWLLYQLIIIFFISFPSYNSMPVLFDLLYLFFGIWYLDKPLSPAGGACPDAKQSGGQGGGLWYLVFGICLIDLPYSPIPYTP
jgi:hypothetical protein